MAKRPTVLAFSRKLDPSDAIFFSGRWESRNQSSQWNEIPVRDKRVRGTISNDLPGSLQDPLKLNAEIQKPNPQWMDFAALPFDADTLRVQFTLRVLSDVGEPSSCNDNDYRKKLLATVAGYAQSTGFDELARRYAANLANGRFLWRNRVGAENVEVVVAHLKDGKAATQWTFKAHDHRLQELSAPIDETADVAALAKLIESGLSGSEKHVLLQIIAFVGVGEGQEVFPSQELILDRGRGDKSKTLYDVDGVAAMHSQKIGNALRTIDTWYPEAATNGPIAVEPYGSVTTQGHAYRPPSPGKDESGKPKEKLDFYNLLDGWIIKDKTPDLEQQHFVIATLIRGGVFGVAG